MRQRKALDGVGSGTLNRGDSFNTEMGMAFSTKNDHEDFTYKEPGAGHDKDHDDSERQSDEEGDTISPI